MKHIAPLINYNLAYGFSVQLKFGKKKKKPISGNSPDISCFLLSKTIASMMTVGVSNIIVLNSAGKAEGKKFLVNSEFSGTGSQEPWQCLTAMSCHRQQDQQMGREL